DIFINNENLKSYSEESFAALRSTDLSIIFQDLRLFSELTLWENLCVKNNLCNCITDTELLEWVKRLGLKDKINASAATLSYGEQQRVAIIRALLQPFSYLLMDEPFSHLDNKNTTLACALILEVAQRNKAGILLADLDPNQYFPYHQTLML
ncbi:MAG: ATP-binding cassette domain-containing protein, partial [Chitinophagaceae bacterium]|nr:ATP-binding cassette domain-containing protein [Chitinophagaceae bacterium]